ncbi:DUF4279 domain-containing protein [Luteimonas sp. RD2P54]|uniref:DUF4279 domain-containing protein n=1 Tax=Luteimonas endophytica TaxID=3042023 RepID=A0ABT6JCU8_9GAMM|nr:DUF4279 domain-containing protein [Luteimonas endophytica]MDH5824649.1 DUF4279 domain-containing protein [Luteimonas endophytica]
MMSSEPHLTSDNFCSIAIYLYGNSISLESVSALLGLTPTRSRNRGDVRVTSSGSEVVQKIGFWEYRVKVNVDQASSSLFELMDLVKCDSLLGQAGIEKAELDIFVPLESGDSESGFSMEMPSGFLARLSKLGFDVVVTSR